MYGIEGVIAGKSATTIGRYGADERSFDIEMVASKDTKPDDLWEEMLRIGAENKQDAIGLSRVLQPTEKVDPLVHRPGMELYFNRPMPLEALQPLIEQLNAKGLEFFHVRHRRPPHAGSARRWYG